LYLCRLYEGKGQQTFEMSIYEMLKLVSNLMCSNSDTTLFLQGACLKYLPHSIPDIMTVFSATQLRYIIVCMYINTLYCTTYTVIFFIIVHC